MRSGARTIATCLAPPVRGWRRMRSHGLTMVGWHRIDGQESTGLSTGVPAFRRHLDELDRWGAEVLPLDAAVRRLRDGTLPDRAVVLTFDDGYASVVETAWPLLRERSWPATLFVVTDSLERELRFSWDSHEPDHRRHRLATAEELVGAAADGLDIGSHTRSHPWLPALGTDELDDELKQSRAVLEALLGRDVTSLAYPSGGWDVGTRAAAAAAGYQVGVTVDRGLNTARCHPLSLRRAFVPEQVDDLRLLLDGAYTFLRPLDAWRTRRGPAW